MGPVSPDPSTTIGSATGRGRHRVGRYDRTLDKVEHEILRPPERLKVSRSRPPIEFLDHDSSLSSAERWAPDSTSGGTEKLRSDREYSHIDSCPVVSIA